MSTAESGTAKGVAVRTHSCSKLGSIYREMGGLFGIERMSGNRRGGLRDPRERRLAHLDHTRMRPLLQKGAERAGVSSSTTRLRGGRGYPTMPRPDA